MNCLSTKALLYQSKNILNKTVKKWYNININADEDLCLMRKKLDMVFSKIG